VVDRFVEAWEGADVDTIRSMLTDDAVLAMPPWPQWFRGRDAVADFLAGWPLVPKRRWKLLPTRANGQVALASYWTDRAARLRAEGLIVLTLTGDGRLSQLTSFRDPSLFAGFGFPEAMDSDHAADL
jgi:RNA polymerase sigma-70 factor (ECF subfamily)